MSTVVRGDLGRCFLGKTRYGGNLRENLPAKRHSSSKGMGVGDEVVES